MENTLKLMLAHHDWRYQNRAVFGKTERNLCLHHEFTHPSLRADQVRDLRRLLRRNLARSSTRIFFITAFPT
jgi:hypothetical protein